jgi:hypothetical protein
MSWWVTEQGTVWLDESDGSIGFEPRREPNDVLELEEVLELR